MKKIYATVAVLTVFLSVHIPAAQALMFSNLNWTGYTNNNYH
jgi:hypothetical protein